MIDEDYIKKLMNNKNKKYTDFNLIYPFSTENFKGFSEEFYIKNKKVLTVAASGDQILDMILLDAKSITAFDINPLCEYYYHLKRAFILSGATLDDYITFFSSINNNDCFNRNDFNIVKKYLEKEYYDFWDNLYQKYSVSKIRLGKNLFSHDESDVSTLRNTLNYFDEDTYKLLQEKLKDYNVDFINSNIKDLNDKLKYKYDLIYLSNIAQYLHCIFDDELSMSELLNKYKEIIYSFDEHLSYRGRVMSAYIYQIKCSSTKSSIKYKKLREKIFTEDFYYMYFRAIASFERITLNNENFDGVMMYKKRNLQNEMHPLK